MLLPVPVHGSRDMPKGLLARILDDADLTADKLRELL
jgi:predicted RNA binding protein YcfA (HicA-like mRNA interferase family)